MAKLDQLPELSIIDGFKHIIDFYYWKGIAVARRWPRYRERTPSDAEATNQSDFAYINQLYSQLPPIVLQGLIDQAKGTTQTPKDYLVRAYLKGLFELMPPEYYMTEETGQEISGRIGNVDGSDVGSLVDRLADLLTELNAKLETTDLNIEAVSKDLQVDDKTDFLNYQDLTRAHRRAALASGIGWTALIDLVGKGLLESLHFTADYKSTELLFSIDGATMVIYPPDGTGNFYLRPDALHLAGGELSWFRETVYDEATDDYCFYLTRPIQFNSYLGIFYKQESGAATNLGLSVTYRLLT